MPLSKLDQWHFLEVVETSGGGLVVEEGYEKNIRALPSFLSFSLFSLPGSHKARATAALLYDALPSIMDCLRTGPKATRQNDHGLEPLEPETKEAVFPLG